MKKYQVYDFVIADRNIVASGKSFSFRSYTDRVGVFGSPGSAVMFNDGSRDKQGNFIGKGFSVGQSHYKLQAREGQKDVEGKSLYDFFLNSPFCEGSPNGTYVDADGAPVPEEDVLDRETNIERLKAGEIKQIGVKIKILDDEKDAQLALETGMKRAEAQLNVGQLDEATLTEMAALIGVFDAPEKITRLKLYEYAGKYPIDYFKQLNSGDRAIRALIRKALADGVFKKKGELIYWKEELMGHNEDAAVTHLLENTDQLNALKENVKFKLPVEKKVGRPRKK